MEELLSKIQKQERKFLILANVFGLGLETESFQEVIDDLAEMVLRVKTVAISHKFPTIIRCDCKTGQNGRWLLSYYESPEATIRPTCSF